MQRKFIKKELPADQLGVKAIDDYTLEVELDNPCSLLYRFNSLSSILPTK